MEHTEKLSQKADKGKISKPSIHSRRIFISYSREDSKGLASKLRADLEARGHTVLGDTQQIRAGQSWEERIESMITDSDILVVLLTPHAVQRPDGVCLGEISLANDAGLKIIPIMVIETRPPLSIFRLDWIDLQNWEQPAQYEAGLQRLIQAVEY